MLRFDLVPGTVILFQGLERVQLLLESQCGQCLALMSCDVSRCMPVVEIDMSVLSNLDRSQSPIFPCDRRDRARPCAHLDFEMYRGGGHCGL